MNLDDAEAGHFKEWIIKRLEDGGSDADSDVLAEYVLALIKGDEPEEELRRHCVENLEDFLRDHTQVFVDDVFNALHAKSYLPGYKPPQAKPTTSPSFVRPTGPAPGPAASGPLSNNNFGGIGVNQSRKRSYNESQANEQNAHRDPHYGGPGINERAIKQTRRGSGRGARHPLPQAPTRNMSPGAFSQMPNMPQMPTPPPGFPPVDPNNPMAAFMAMQAMGFPGMPGFPGFPGAGSPPPQAFAQQNGSPPPGMQNAPKLAKSGQRCRDYDTQGFCPLGEMCPHEHGDDRYVVPNADNEYDPQNAMMGANTDHPQSNGRTRPFRGGSERGSRGYRGGRGQPNANRRAPFSSAAPNHDRNVTSIVVEQIPEEKFSEEAVREFFSEFGAINKVDMQPYKRLAVMHFADYAGAKRAYDSPKVIFDNRFVKVYWYKPGAAAHGQSSGAPGYRQADAKPDPDEMEIDPEEFSKKQAEAQRQHEEKAKKLQEAEAAKQDLDRRIKEQAEERKKLMEKLATKTKPSLATANSGTAAESNHASTAEAANGVAAKQAPDAKTGQTETLRAKLAELQAEAETLGIAADDGSASAAPYSPSRGRGGYAPYYYPRGRGRGSYNPSYRGGFAPRGRGAVGGVARLDNRPRNVKVVSKDGAEGVDFADEKVLEALRGHLVTVGDFASITPTSANADNTATGGAAKKDAAIVSFNERYVAEMFIGRPEIPGIGKVDFSWVANGPPATASAAGNSVAPGGKPASPALAGGASALSAAAPAFAPAAGAPGVANGTVTVPGTGAGAGMGAGGGVEKSTGDAMQKQAPADKVDWDVADDDEDRWMH